MVVAVGAGYNANILSILGWQAEAFSTACFNDFGVTPVAISGCSKVCASSSSRRSSSFKEGLSARFEIDAQA